MITLLALIFGEKFLDPRLRAVLLVVGLTFFAYRARKAYVKYKAAKEAENDYMAALVMQAKTAPEGDVTPQPKVAK